MDVQILNKGEKINIAEKAPNLKSLLVGMGWDVNEGRTGGQDFDLDVTAALCGADKKLLRDPGDPKSGRYLIYYGNLKFTTDSGVDAVVHSADDLTGGSSEKGDDETINFRLTQLPQEVENIYIFGNIFSASARRQEYGMVNNSYLRLVDADSEVEIARHDLKAEYAGKTAVMLARLYRMGADWKLEMLAEGCDGSIEDVLKHYGLE